MQHQWWKKMTQTTQFYKKFFHKRVKDEKERQDVLSFLEKEKFFDEQNALEFENMDKSHLNKTRMNQMNSAIKRWNKDNEKLVKTFIECKTTSFAISRTWL